MNPTCFNYLTETTLAFPNIYDDGRTQTEINLWGWESECVKDWERVWPSPGASAWMCGDSAFKDIRELVIESGMHWDYGPYRSAVLAHIDEMEEWEEHGTAYELWCPGEVNMDDLHEASFFTEYCGSEEGDGALKEDNPGYKMLVSAGWKPGEGLGKNGDGIVTPVGALPKSIIRDKGGKPVKFTPEMLVQRNTLNWLFNFQWNQPQSLFATPRKADKVPDTIELLTLTKVGENHGVAKSQFGGVFVPMGALKHLQRNGGTTVGTIFDGEITFTPHNKFPWRLTRNGVKFTYEDMCGTRTDDY